MKKTLQRIELLLGGRLKEASDDEVLQLFFLSVCELAFIKAHKIWVGKVTGKRYSSKQALAMAGDLYWEAKRRMKLHRKKAAV